ncbi:hypothetical protein KQ944_18150 [Bacillus subtilis]|uniref:hypothetical protein n=1 Tax=Pseudochrobactrum asaccharolyticum TaxID=354351 RepID=UPI001F19F954|nr:hypothetical protein [Pseudochrobactrum asaccharolyticum]MCF7646920.1 hypothetical protein [Pseudochrobactrum asaccharolyticum]MCF7673562.1 hypothetical protein [Bacillus subtilis]
MEEAFKNTAAVIAFIGVIFTAVLTFWSSRRNSYMTIIVAEQAKWLNELRTDFANLLSELSSIHVKHVTKKYIEKDSKIEIEIDVKKVEYLINIIYLKLNNEQNNIAVTELKNLVNSLPSATQAADPLMYRRVEKEVLNLANFILNDGWSLIDIEVKGVMWSWLSARIWKRDMRISAFNSTQSWKDD